MRLIFTSHQLFFFKPRKIKHFQPAYLNPLNLRKKYKHCLIVTLVLFIGVFSNGSHAIDSVRYIKLANATIQEANGGFVPSINYLIETQKTLMEIGVAGSQEYGRQHPEYAAVLNEVIDNAEAMIHMSLDEIDSQWHQGEYLRAQGYDLDELDHYGHLISLINSIVHPATVFIVLNEYKRTRDTQYLRRTSAELSEVIKHVSHINPSSKTLATKQ